MVSFFYMQAFSGIDESKLDRINAIFTEFILKILLILSEYRQP